MSKQATNSTKDSGRLTVFVGAHIPLQFYHLLVEEAEGAGTSRSEVLRRILANRYNHKQGASEEERHNEP
jgi:hypothetical protein